MEKQEIIKYDSGSVEKLPISNMNDLVLLGDFIAQSQMLGASSPAAGMIIASTCVQERMSLLEFGRRYHVDNRGKVTMRSDRMLAEFMALGGEVEWIKWDAESAKAKWTYKKNVDKEIEFTFQEAKDAGYIKPGSNWEKDPAAQLRARLITRAVRMICPAAVAGVYAPEEMQDVYNSEETPTEPKPANIAKKAGTAPSTAKTTQTPSTSTEQGQNAEIPTTATVVVMDDPGTPFDDVDYSICPRLGCPHDGKPWTGIPAEELQVALTLADTRITEQHKIQIAEAIKCQK